LPESCRVPRRDQPLGIDIIWYKAVVFIAKLLKNILLFSQGFVTLGEGGKEEVSEKDCHHWDTLLQDG